MPLWRRSPPSLRLHFWQFLRKTERPACGGPLFYLRSVARYVSLSNRRIGCTAVQRTAERSNVPTMNVRAPNSYHSNRSGSCSATSPPH